nr:MAG TPA: hypothetical protein [Bacteriophage sp.]
MRIHLQRWRAQGRGRRPDRRDLHRDGAAHARAA